MNKKGQGLTIPTIVIIILALVVLVVLIYGFTVGWGNLFQNIQAFGGRVNVQNVITGCKISCDTNAAFDYCAKERNVVFSRGEDPVSLTCKDLEGRGVNLATCNNVDCTEFEKIINVFRLDEVKGTCEQIAIKGADRTGKDYSTTTECEEALAALQATP